MKRKTGISSQKSKKSTEKEVDGSLSFAFTLEAICTAIGVQNAVGGSEMYKMSPFETLRNVQLRYFYHSRDKF